MTDVICDLDGVLYRGETQLPGSSEALQRLREVGSRVIFVTNNSTRTPEQVAKKIERLAGVSVAPTDVMTSSMAAASLLSQEDSPVLIVGEEGVAMAVRDADAAITDDSAEARSVVVGMDRSLTYEALAAAADAVRWGARFIATNNDPTFPTRDGLLPGAGAVVAAIATASGRRPEIAGKPHTAMKTLIRAAGVESAWVIGDRMDTDIALTVGEPHWRSILVLTGVTGRADDTSDADHVVEDMLGAVEIVLGANKEQ